jgi:hypothetical protein
MRRSEILASGGVFAMDVVASGLGMIEGPVKCKAESLAVTSLDRGVDSATCSYAVLWSAFKRLTAGEAKEEKTGSSAARRRESIGSIFEYGDYAGRREES